MKTRSLLYLAQLEEYNSKRVNTWLINNPDNEVKEIKNHLKWTLKAYLIYLLALLLTPFFNSPKHILIAMDLIAPVDDTVKKIFIKFALIKFRLLHPHITVIGITGSWGKTTTKEILYSLLKNNYNTIVTPENKNTLIYTASMLLKLPIKTKILICEIGAHEPGDIRNVCNLVKPTIGIITVIGPMHLERFGTEANILKTKMELVESLPKDGLVFVPSNLKKQIDNFSHPHNTVFFNKLNEVYLHLARYFKLNTKTVSKLLTSHATPNHRQNIIHKNGLSIIDDTYNSNPEGFKRALVKLKNIKTKQKIIITPGMIELGHMQYQKNYEAAKLAASICTDIVIIGKTNKDSLEAGVKDSNSEINLYWVATLTDAQNLISKITKSNAGILFENDLPDHYF